jgi:hypothetical protein
LGIGRAGNALSWLLNGLAQLQPFKIDALAPMLVLEIRKCSAS